MGHDRLRGTGQALENLVLQQAVGMGDAFMVPKVFQPRLGEEGFKVAAAGRRILEQLPIKCAIPPPGDALLRR